MLLLFKLALFLVVLCFGNIKIINLLDKANCLTEQYMVFVVIEIIAIIGVVFYLYIFKSLSGLYEALKIIDFDKDVIDFSKLDSLGVTGAKEIRFITTKLKYLLDILTERINKVNSETYKSEHDGLTGCYNRVRLDKTKSFYECSNSVAIVFIDVNNLKRMNDEFGHEAGDSLLRSAASKLTFWSSYGDVYRMGGDEFMIVLVNKSKNDVKKLVNTWYPTVGQLNRDSDGFKCVLSYGVAFGTKGCNFDALQKVADDRMYDMKVALKKKFGEPMR